MGMKQVANGVLQIDGRPANAINAYLVERPEGHVLIDAGTRWDRWRLARVLRGRKLSLVALTHVHPDHQGAARRICETFAVPLACHAADRDIMEGRAAMRPRSLPIRLSNWLVAGPLHPVSRVLNEGDDVAGFRVIETPGHTPGHVSMYRAADGVLITGDVMANMNFITMREWLREPPDYFSCDPAENRRSIRKLAALRPSVCLFGHGRPLRDPAKLAAFAAALPA